MIPTATVTTSAICVATTTRTFRRTKMGTKKPEKNQTAPRRCAKPDCRKLQPCPLHPQGWASSNSEPLPSNWGRLVRETRVEYEGKCGKCGAYCNEKGSCDHIIPRSRGGGHERSNRMWLCPRCHSIKSRRESKDGIRRKSRRFPHEPI